MNQINPSLFIATPTLDGKVGVSYISALLTTLPKLIQKGIRYNVQYLVGCSLIGWARNQLVHDFLKTDFTDLLFIDSDIGWQPDDLIRLIQYPAPLVAGSYELRRQSVEFNVKFKPIITTNALGLISVARIGTGFMRINRECFEVLKKCRPDLKDNKGIYHFFETALVNGEYLGEDYHFCDLWTSIGGEVLMDPVIQLSHVDRVERNGNIMDYLTKNHDK